MSLQEQLIGMLRKRKMTITTAESLTGGLIAATLVEVPGASEVLREAYVTYCDDAKHKLAGVSRETLQRYTAVSAETAREMAEGIRAAAEADVALSATGLAGPDGGTPDCPVGTVYIACSIGASSLQKNEPETAPETDVKTVVRELHLSGTRGEIRAQTVQEAFTLACEMFRIVGAEWTNSKIKRYKR